jgi:hypothetical protein
LALIVWFGAGGICRPLARNAARPAPLGRTNSAWKGEIMMGDDYASVGLVFFLFGIFCAYWAQTTGRNAWLWFFLGLFFAPITGLVLLYENSKETS